MLDPLTFFRLHARSHGVLDPKVTDVGGTLRAQAFNGGRSVTYDVANYETATTEQLKTQAIQFAMVVRNA